ncbi:MAG: UDP-N-acetylglucosamine 2-epimerase (non-hydrolyzing) [Betaproteobacteria bacterium]|nr:MAG: UDP-N-acetylglucosamine 2-epimerase (non-hydrolyzing) [Betaproteobacteria bacterium]
MSDLAKTLGSVMCVVGARPNYMKMAPLIRALRGDPAAPRTTLVHTGQHYDVAMNDRLFADLKLGAPDVNLDVGSGTHAQQTAEIMRRFEPVIDAASPSCVVVVGDVNSTLACSLVAVKKGVPIVHVEAGLRSFDRTMPEEINRLLTDQICDVLYTTERSAADNLRREGIRMERVHFVGNVMIDSLRVSLPHAVPPRAVLASNGLSTALVGEGSRFGLVTLHRPSNVDEQGSLAEALAILGDVSRELPLVWPMHPRTRANIERFGLWRLIDAKRLIALPPQGYLETLGLIKDATLVITDSGGIQEETTALGVPCLTMRENTERPVTVDEGTNVLVGRKRPLVRRCVEEILAGGGKRGRVPELWDGHASERIANHLTSWLARRVESVYA